MTFLRMDADPSISQRTETFSESTLFPKKEALTVAHRHVQRIFLRRVRISDNLCSGPNIEGAAHWRCGSQTILGPLILANPINTQISEDQRADKGVDAHMATSQ